MLLVEGDVGPIARMIEGVRDEIVRAAFDDGVVDRCRPQSIAAIIPIVRRDQVAVVIEGGNVIGRVIGGVGILIMHRCIRNRARRGMGVLEFMELIEIEKAANLDPLEFMGRVLKGYGDGEYG